MEDIRIHALEGSMIASPEGLGKLLELAKVQKEHSVVYVISPLHEGTLSFHSLLQSAKDHDEKLWSLTEKAQTAWEDLTETVLAMHQSAEAQSLMAQGFEEVEDILRAVWLLKDISEATEKRFASLTSYYLALLAYFLFTCEKMPTEIKSIDKALLDHSFPRGANFIYGVMPQSGSERPDASGRVRDEGESEYAASLLASRTGAYLTFWNNRSLLCSARRKDVPAAHVIGHLSYAEATELSFFGAPIVHPHAFLPASSQGLPIRLRFWGELDDEGTLVTSKPDNGSKNSVKAFSVVRNVSVINIEGAGMSGVPGISSRLFTSLRESGISVILISQASSEYSICFAIPSTQANEATRLVRREFATEIDNQAISSVSCESDTAILAAVGEAMTGQIGVAGKFFSSLAKAGVNVRAIAQGASERNISAVIASVDSIKALRALHSVFFLSGQTLSVGLFGPGNIGGTLLDQIGREAERLKRDFDVDIRIRAIANSHKMLLSEEGVDLSQWREAFSIGSRELDMHEYLTHVGASYYPHAVLVDCTTSQDLAKEYSHWLQAGFHVITPNKKAATASYAYYREILEMSRHTGKRFLYETTVGAGLPVIRTLQDLLLTGDKVLKVEGIVSGTLAWLFSKYDGTVPFSRLVLEAKELGYTEPDPRDDLSGMDVARKTVILARELGYSVEVSDLSITSLVPEQLRAASREEFLSRLSEMDADMLIRYRKAEKEGRKLRYVGKVDNGICSVSLDSYASDHPFAQASGTDNVISFTTSRYNEAQPLVVKGPGAGPEVTAGGVFSDILRLSAYLGARI